MVDVVAVALLGGGDGFIAIAADGVPRMPIILFDGGADKLIVSAGFAAEAMDTTSAAKASIPKLLFPADFFMVLSSSFIDAAGGGGCLGGNALFKYCIGAGGTGGWGTPLLFLDAAARILVSSIL